MDYETKPTNLKAIRKFAKVFRQLFDVPLTGAFPVLEALERIGDVFDGCNYLIVEDKKLPPQTMAGCEPNENGGFTIKIKQSIYDGAYEKEIGAFRGFICHEMCHIFLFKIGFVPTYERSFANNALPAYRSVEWQAKALCGEVMISFEESKDMSIDEIISKYKI